MFFKKKPEVTEIQTIQTLTYITIAPNGVKCFLMLNDLLGGRYSELLGWNSRLRNSMEQLLRNSNLLLRNLLLPHPQQQTISPPAASIFWRVSGRRHLLPKIEFLKGRWTSRKISGRKIVPIPGPKTGDFPATNKCKEITSLGRHHNTYCGATIVCVANILQLNTQID